MSDKAKISLVKEINYNLIFDIFLKEKELSIPELINISELSLPTVTRAVDFGLKIKLLSNYNIAKSNGGRKAQLYTLNRDFSNFLLIFYANGFLYYEVRDLYLHTILKDTKKTAYSTILNDLEDIIYKVINKNNKVNMVAISLNGVIHNGEIINWWANPKMNGFHIENHLRSKFGIEIIVENTMRAVTLASRNYVLDFQDKNIVCLQFGNDGFGAGFIMDGQILRGKSGFAGELGYLPLTLEYEYSLQFCSKLVQTVVSMFAPDSVIVYFTTQKDAIECVRKNLSAHIPDYAFPQIIEGNDFEKDTFFGLTSLCLNKMKENILKL